MSLPVPDPVPEDGDHRTHAVYARLREIARGCLRGERRDHTLQATALANEVYLKLGDLDELPPDHLGPIVATACRRVLVDHARARGRAGGRPRAGGDRHRRLGAGAGGPSGGGSAGRRGGGDQ